MKKKTLCLTFLLAVCLLFSSCEMHFGSKRIEDSKEYGKWESYLDIPDFLPSSVDDYRVNGYAYTLEAYMDICYEVFVDITVTKEQFDELIARAKAHPDYICERPAYYSDGYVEIILEDFYEIDDRREDDLTLRVGWADVEKVIYNEETQNIIYVCFHANDSGVYRLENVEYFNRFSINEEEYVQNLDPKTETKKY